jgi:hypothetical protein
MKGLIAILLLFSSLAYAQLTPIARTGDISDSLSSYTDDVLKPTIADSLIEIREEISDAVLEGAMGSLTSTYMYVGNASDEPTAVDITGDISVSNTGVVSITEGSIVNADIDADAGIDASKIGDKSVSTTEFQYINSLTSNAQTQLNSKASSASLTSHTSDATIHFTQGEISALNSTQISTGDVTNTHFNYISGLESNAQTQINTLNTKVSALENDTSFMSISMNSIQSNENVGLVKIPTDITIFDVNSVVTTSNAGSVTFQIYTGTSRATATDSLFSAKVTANNTTTGTTHTIVDDSLNVNANNFIWFKSGTLSNIVDNLSVTIGYYK